MDTDDAADAADTASAYVDMLRYAPCLVPFEDRVSVFQALVEQERWCGTSPLSSWFSFTIAHHFKPLVKPLLRLHCVVVQPLSVCSLFSNLQVPWCG
jgi:hypothetical protein